MTRAGLLLAVMLILIPTLPAEHIDDGRIRWACGFGGGHPDDCGIDPVGGSDDVGSDGDPTFSDDWLASDERVLGVAINGDARAYPIRLLDRHEIVNDVIGGTPVAVTYCPLCGSGVTFDRRIALDGQVIELEFAASGYLFQNDLVMWDPQTSTLWNQITGSPIATLRDGDVEGDHIDAVLDVIPTLVMPWSEWVDRHRDAVMLQPVFAESSYGYPYGNYQSDCDHGLSRGACQVGGLHAKERVVGIEEPAPHAFVIAAIQAQGGVAIETVSGRTIVATATPGGATVVYDAAGMMFTQDPSGLWMDETGGLWDLRSGERVDKPGILDQVDSLELFWFAWDDHHPDTTVWNIAADPSGDTPTSVEDDGKLPGFTVWVIALLFIAGAVWARRRRA